jgi:recombination protein RecA
MAKTKKSELTEEDLFAQIAQETGGDILSKLDSVKYFIDTGSLAINYICSGKFIKGGIPAGKITEIYGPSSSGKSLVASNVLYGCQKINGWPIILDCENATNGEFMQKTSHLNLNRVLRYTPKTLEEAFLRIHTTVKKIREIKGHDVPIVVVYDSISVSPCEREFKETNLPQDYKPSDWKKIVGRQEQPGERAKVCSRELRKLQPMLEGMNVTVMIINQTREKIGVLYGNPETTAGGGNALPFYASCRLRSATRKKIENKRLDTFAGVNMHMKNVKNRTFKPFVETEGVQLFFDTGINPVSGLLTCLLESERIVGSKGNFKVNRTYLPDGSQDYSFKSSKERNDVPVQVLLDCPKLIDAESTQEVETYLSSFMDAIRNSNSDDFTEKAVAFDADGNPMDQEDPETMEQQDE